MMTGKQQTWVFVLLGILMARGMLFETLTPFALAYFGVMYDLRKPLRIPLAIAIFFGALVSEHHHMLRILIGCAVFAWLYTMVARRKQLEFTHLPLLICMASFLSLLGSQLVTLHMDWFQLFLTLAEASLSYVLAIIFMQALPILLDGRRREKWRTEELICILIVISAAMIGTVGWAIEGIAMENVLSRYLLVLLALIGGVPLGATVGVVSGLIISFVHPGSVTQVGILAFAGLLAGLLREGKRLGVGFGMLIGSAILSLYIGDTDRLFVSLSESAVAILLLMATPQRVVQSIAQWIPGTQAYANHQLDYARRVREMTASRVQQFADVFRHLAESFAPQIGQVQSGGNFPGRTIRINEHTWRNQMIESRKLVADQLFGVSSVMDDLVDEMKREGQQLFRQEEQIRQALDRLGLSIPEIEIISLDEGRIEIEMLHQFVGGMDECRKIIAPLLSDITGETIVVKRERFGATVDGFYTVTFGTARQFDIETGIAGVAKGGEAMSGDSHSTVELSSGKYAIALSDGMGNGWRANGESQAALSILQKLLASGMDERLAIKSVNSVLLLRSQEEMFATIDLALVDLNSGRTSFLKIGSTPSFIKRGHTIIPITAHNLPAGILQDIDVDAVRVDLFPGDILIMMTDGVYDAPGTHGNKERWMQRMIREIPFVDAQTYADAILEHAIRYQDGRIRDDMTVVVARVDHYVPAWSSFRWEGMPRLERPITATS